MKNSRLVLAAVAALGLAATPAMAQYEFGGASGGGLSAKIPFSFAINRDTVLPAGEYVVSRLGVTGTVWKFLNLNTWDAGVVMAGVSMAGIAEERPHLTFDCDAEVCALREIRFGYGVNGYEVPLSTVRSSNR
jgi:hypothetical protein